MGVVCVVCVPRRCARVWLSLQLVLSAHAPRRFIFTYGMLIYKLLGDQAQSEFARTWGISYAMNAVTEWRDIAVEAVKATIILIILERLFLTRNSAWLEELMDYLSLQARARGWGRAMRAEPC